MSKITMSADEYDRREAIAELAIAQKSKSSANDPHVAIP
jgi:hypothetical protein